MPNRLAQATSPYLLQHRDNPVDWWEWGPRALAEAEASGRPILLSIGYAACHWCHVMAHESFENPATAELMNQLFVNIKVDREERPDVDQIYMIALQALGQPGGWPLTMFLTPKGEPFWGGTYFPDRPRFGQPAFTDVLKAVARTFHEEPDRVRHNSAALLGALRATTAAAGGAGLDRAALDAIAGQVVEAFDPELGGLRGAPKFPNATLLELIDRAGHRTGDPRFHAALDRTLDRIAAGGIHDHIGGGFARYAVDERWLVPHFEKMLYDNAQLLELFARAARRTARPVFLRAAEGIVAWLEREMLVDGAFAASLDADQDGHEGAFYVWTRDELDHVLPLEDAALFARWYDVTPQGNWEGKAIPNRLATADADEATEQRLAGLAVRLREARDGRVRPGRDDKVLADWNGLMIAALAEAGALLERPDWVERARRAYDVVRATVAIDGRPAHAWREGRLVGPAFASDLAQLARAALSLHAVTGDAALIAEAETLVELIARHHIDRDTGLVALNADDGDALVHRPTSTFDDATPNHHGTLALTLLRLAALTGDDRHRQRGEALLLRLGEAMGRHPIAHAALLNALDERLGGAEIVVIGDGPAAEALAAEARSGDPARHVLAVPRREDLPAGHAARGAGALDGAAAALICVGDRCSLPTSEPRVIDEQVRTMRAAA